MKRLVIALLLCGALIGGSIWSCRAVDTAVAQITAQIEAGDLPAAQAEWQRAQPLLGGLLQHTALEPIDRLFARVTAAQRHGADEAHSADRAELLTQLRSLPDMLRPTLKNLL